jgi:hypothetical protein
MEHPSRPAACRASGKGVDRLSFGPGSVINHMSILGAPLFPALALTWAVTDSENPTFIKDYGNPCKEALF